MRYAGVFLLVGFVGIAVFGIFGVHAGMQNHNSGCIAATAQGTDCPKQNNLLAYLAFHLSAFKSFSTAAFGDAAISLLLFSLLAIGVVFGVDPKNSPAQQSAYYRLTSPALFRPLPHYGLVHWLALHENSPAPAQDAVIKPFALLC